MSNTPELQNYNPEQIAFEATTNKMIRKVYLWMCAALAITGMTAYYVASSPEILSVIFSSKAAFFGILIAELVLVLILSAAIDTMSAGVATILFILYSVLNGVVMSSIFLVYEFESIATTFFVSAGMFGVMALVGTITKKDLTKVGNILIMALLGLIIAAVVNIFLMNETMDMIVCGVGVLIFVGLTAYDAQKIKALLAGEEENDRTSKLAVLGALSLYLDFINIFLYLLRLFGRRR